MIFRELHRRPYQHSHDLIEIHTAVSCGQSWQVPYQPPPKGLCPANYHKATNLPSLAQCIFLFLRNTLTIPYMGKKVHKILQQFIRTNLDHFWKNPTSSIFCNVTQGSAHLIHSWDISHIITNIIRWKGVNCSLQELARSIENMVKILPPSPHALS